MHLIYQNAKLSANCQLIVYLFWTNLFSNETKYVLYGLKMPLINM